MNPLTNVKNITKLNETELSAGTTNKKSWHDMYKESAWIFIGGLPYDLTEGDILTVFSQYGEIVNINLVRDKKTGKTKGFCFLCYANQKSTILAVDNFNGIKICGRTIRVDHVANYKPPKEDERDDELTKALKAEGCAPKPIKIEPTESPLEKKKKKKVKKEKKKKKDKKSDKREEVKVKIEKHDPGYDKYEHPNKYAEAKEHEHNSQKIDAMHSSNNHNHVKNNDKHHKIDSYLSKNKNIDSVSKYPTHGKRHNDSSSSSDNSFESEKDYQNKRKAASSRKDSSSFSSRNVERNRETDVYYRHKPSNYDHTGQRHGTSREYKQRHDEDKHKSVKHKRQNSSSSSDEDRSSKRYEKRTKKHYDEESFSGDKSKTSVYEQKHRSHNSSRREEYYGHKGHHK